MLASTVLLLIPIVTSIVDDVMEAFDPSHLDEAIREFKDIHGVTTDEAQRELAKKFDAAFDWKEALSHAGVGAALVGDILEYLDYNIWYMAIKVHCKAESRQRARLIRRWRNNVPRIMNEYLSSDSSDSSE